MIRTTPGYLLLTIVAAPLSAQAAANGGNLGVNAAHNIWMMNASYITQAAQDMPEAKYAFKATPAVRSFGQLIGHVAGSQYMFCAAAIGETVPAEDDIEKTKTSKADLVTAMQASNDYCAKAYAQTDMAARAEVTMFGQKVNRLWVLNSNGSHTAEHYGNLVTYLRLNGMVPPSSKAQ